MCARIALGKLKLVLSQFPGRFCAPRLIEPSSSIGPGHPLPIAVPAPESLELATPT
jgi:hypothetical protein